MIWLNLYIRYSWFAIDIQIPISLCYFLFSRHESLNFFFIFIFYRELNLLVLFI